jgi:hypothetical protein
MKRIGYIKIAAAYSFWISGPVKGRKHREADFLGSHLCFTQLVCDEHKVGYIAVSLLTLDASG